MRQHALLSAAVGGVCGLLAGLAGARWFESPVRGEGHPGTLRGDLDDLEARMLESAASDLTARALVLDRLAAIEHAAGAASTAADRDSTRRAVGAVAEDLKLLAAALRADLHAADQRLAGLESRSRELELTVGATVGAAPGPLSDEDEAVWVTTARNEDPLRRFSALVRLSRRRSERSVQSATEALRDSDERVVWQAVRNLSGFQERGALRDIAPRLDHPATIVRQAAFEALTSMGAPNLSYDPAATAATRRADTELLKKWVSEQP